MVKTKLMQCRKCLGWCLPLQMVQLYGKPQRKCKACDAAEHRQQYAKDPERYRARAKARYRNDPVYRARTRAAAQRNSQENVASGVSRLYKMVRYWGDDAFREQRKIEQAMYQQFLRLAGE